MLIISPRIVRAAILAVVFVPSVVVAQSGGSSSRAGGTFGGGASSTRTMLDLGLELSESLESELPVEFRRRNPQGGLQSGGYSSLLSASADFTRDRRLGKITGVGLVSFRYYDKVDRVRPVGHTAALGATLRLRRNVTFDVNQTGAYSPSYLYQLFPSATQPAPGQAIPVAAEYRVEETKSYAYGTSLALNVGPPRGARVSVRAARNRTDFQGGSASRPDMATDNIAAGFTKGVGRDGQFTSEYEYRLGTFGLGDETEEHRVRIGGQYSRALSSSRRATFRFSVAPASQTIPPTAHGVSGTLYRLEADGSASYAFRRSWAFDGNYRRSVEYIAVLREPVFQDALRLQLGGLVTRRVNVSANAGYATGQSALTSRADGFDTYTGAVRAQVALGRSVAVFSEFLYYRYDMRGESVLAPDLPDEFEQRSVRAGLTLWARPVGR